MDICKKKCTFAAAIMPNLLFGAVKVYMLLLDTSKSLASARGQVSYRRTEIAARAGLPGTLDVRANHRVNNKLRT